MLIEEDAQRLAAELAKIRNANPELAKLDAEASRVSLAERVKNKKE
jgi:hypothetical protein